MPRSRQEPTQVRRLRTAILLVLAAVLISVGIAGIMTIFNPIGDPDAGQHYTELPGLDAPRDQPIRVTEYFSYLCQHCRNFEPQASEWAASLPAGVEYERVPVTFSASLRRLAQGYYANRKLGLEARNHRYIFDAIHRDGRRLDSTAAIAELLDGRGATAAELERAMRSPDVRRQVSAADQQIQAHRVMSVPALVVDGRYRIDASQLSRRDMLRVADRLIERELTLRTDAD